MPRRVVYVTPEELEVLRVQEEMRTGNSVRFGYVAGDSPWAELLWKEIRQIERRSSMTSLQKTVWECYLSGYPVEAIAEVFNRNESSIRQALNAAEAKAESVEYCGLLTSMIEDLGWQQVRLYLSALTDRATPRIVVQVMGKNTPEINFKRSQNRKQLERERKSSVPGK